MNINLNNEDLSLADFEADKVCNQGYSLNELKALDAVIYKKILAIKSIVDQGVEDAQEYIAVLAALNAAHELVVNNMEA